MKYVHIVDDDRDVRQGLSFMLGLLNYQTLQFSSGPDFLSNVSRIPTGVVVVDLRMPGVDGFQVFSEMKRRGVAWPVIVMTGHGEVPLAVHAMREGAIDFIEKPFTKDAVEKSLNMAFERLAEVEEERKRRQQFLEKISSLTRREFDVLRGLVAGLPNKSIARALNVSLRTVEMHRANMMDRLQVESLSEALSVAIAAGVEPMPRQEANASIAAN